MKILSLDEQDSFPLIGLQDAVRPLPGPTPWSPEKQFERGDHTSPKMREGLRVKLPLGCDSLTEYHKRAGYTNEQETQYARCKAMKHALCYGADPKPGVYRTKAGACWAFNGKEWFPFGENLEEEIIKEFKRTGGTMKDFGSRPMAFPQELEVLYVAD